MQMPHRASRASTTLGTPVDAEWAHHNMKRPSQQWGNPRMPQFMLDEVEIRKFSEQNLHDTLPRDPY